MKRKPSIRSRLIFGNLTLLGAAFLAVFIVFNISVNEFIRSSAEDELIAASKMVGPVSNTTPRADLEHSMWQKDRGGRPPSPIGADAHMFILDGEDVLAGDPYDEDDDIEEGIAENLQRTDGAGSIQTVTTSDGTFLVYALAPPDSTEERSIVFYVDVTDLQNFARSINVMLIIVLVVVGAAAVAVSFAMASSVVKPLEQLAGFARRLGNNDFEPSTLHFRDREPAELLRVMNTTAKKLAAYDSDQKTFFQNVSHELKTPLMAIRCNAEGVAFNVMDPDKSAHTIMRETDRLGEMIDDLLFISKADTITASEVLVDCDVREILSNCVESQRAAAEKKGIEVICDFSEAPVMREVSEKSMQRALSNLVSNAVRYAAHKVVLGCTMRDGKAVVTVWNDGPKISDTDLPHIFERFYKGAGGQSGIGLSIVKSVIEKLGGSVGVETDSDATQFTAEF